MSIPQDNLNALTAFAETARRFCEFIDTWKTGKPPGLYTTLEKLLAQLHTAILPVVNEWPGDVDQFDHLGMTSDQSSEISRMIDGITGEEMLKLIDHHESLRDKTNPEGDYLHEAAVTRATLIFDDLADTYRTLHDGLELWTLGTDDARAHASWTWRWGFEQHWGDHLFRVTLSVHEIRYDLFVD